MFNKLKRIGTTACKVQITIELKRLTILESKDCRSGLFIELERGSKSVKTTPRDSPSENNDSKLVLQYDESLTVVMTLYKDSAGKYGEKKGKLLLKGYSKVTAKEVKLGSVKLSMHTLADDYEKKNMTLQFEDVKGRPMGVIDVSTTSKYLGDAQAGDDDSSVVSGMSRSTFSSASHMDVIQGLGGSVAVNPSKRDRTGRFDELEAKAALAVKIEQEKKQADRERQQEELNNYDSDSEVPVHSAFASKPQAVVNKPAAVTVVHKEPEPIHYVSKDTKKEIVALNEMKFVSKELKEKDQGYHGNAGTTKKNELTYVDSPSNPTVTGNQDAKDQEIISLRQQLKDAQKFQTAMEEEFQTKITSMIERIIEIEDESEQDHYNHEQETIKILKAAGIYHKAGKNLRDADNNLTYSDDWADLFRELADEERMKVMALKKCLLRFSNELSSEDTQDLMDAGIALTVSKPSKR